MKHTKNEYLTKIMAMKEEDLEEEYNKLKIEKIIIANKSAQGLNPNTSGTSIGIPTRITRWKFAQISKRMDEMKKE
jgi:hypothetical protein